MNDTHLIHIEFDMITKFLGRNRKDYIKTIKAEKALMQDKKMIQKTVESILDVAFKSEVSPYMYLNLKVRKRGNL